MTQTNKKYYFGKDLEAMSFANNYHRWLLAEFLPYLKGSVAEVGAGIGNVSKLILESNINSLTAFEPSVNMYPLLEKAFKKDMRAKAVNDFLCIEDGDASFDSVLYVNVLEHIEDDVCELACAHTAMTSGGHIMIFVPALPWLYSELDTQFGHFRRYTKDRLLALIQRSGFSIVKARYFDLAGIIPWFINYTLLKNTMNGQNVFIYDRLVVPVMRVIESLVSPFIGKNILLVARKK
ncbi:class I SAM-dependent methyltransferase [uncultured Desulfobacter sp.]|uniref:class I SAM-dependent methyltransferase n=1 Tax=uncultured Desulfobacter sp. TaxID=240139 RepID=UPI0029F5A5FA|nr:class I SAM-dependent methyltransferase [uncultured Desulfobacter sp.]